LTDEEIYRWLYDTEPSPLDDPSRIHTGELEAIVYRPGDPVGSFADKAYRQSGITDWAAEKAYSEKQGRVLLTIFALSVGSILMSGLVVVAALWIWGNR